MTRINYTKLERVYEAIRQDPAFEHLRLGGNPLIEGEGDNPVVMLIGEAPGPQERAKGRPFIGPAGIVLRQLMYVAGLCARDDEPLQGNVANCWLTNVVKYYPPRTRTPTWEEIQNSRKYLRQEWVAIGKPDIIITIGASPLSAVLGRKGSIMARAGRMFTNQNSTRKPEVMTFWPMLHTSFGLRNPTVQPTIEEHWLKMAEWFQNHPTIERCDGAPF